MRMRMVSSSNLGLLLACILNIVDGANWQASEWGMCSKPCDGGVQTRNVSCASAGEVVSQSM